MLTESAHTSLEIRVFREILDDKLFLYKIDRGKINIIKLNAKYEILFNVVEKEGEKERIIEEIARISNVSRETAMGYWNAFYKNPNFQINTFFFINYTIKLK